MDDEMIKLMAEKGGVIQITFGSMFVNGQVNKAAANRRKQINEYAEAKELTDDEKEKHTREFLKENPIGDADVWDPISTVSATICPMA